MHYTQPLPGPVPPAYPQQQYAVAGQYPGDNWFSPLTPPGLPYQHMQYNVHHSEPHHTLYPTHSYPQVSTYSPPYLPAHQGDDPRMQRSYNRSEPASHPSRQSVTYPSARPVSHGPTEPIHAPPEGHNHIYYQEDPAIYPTIEDWLTCLDDDPTGSSPTDQFSQYSRAFNIKGLRMLLDLSDLSSIKLSTVFSIPEATGDQLLEFARADVVCLQAGEGSMQKRARR